MIFYIWTLPAWQAFCNGAAYQYPERTIHLDEAQEEYGCGMIITTLYLGRHIPVKPVTIN